MASVLSDHALTKGIKTEEAEASIPTLGVLSDHALTKGIKTQLLGWRLRVEPRPVGPRPD